MIRRYTLACLLLLFFVPAKADHLSGSELIYEYLSPGAAPNTQRFRFTFRLFRGCASTSPPLSTESVTLGIYRNSTLAIVQQLSLSYTGNIDITLNTAALHCFSGSLPACYGVGIFQGTIDLPISADGYTASWIRCCRPTDIVNLPNTDIGVTPFVVIPGSTVVGTTGHNSSASFPINDTSLSCAGKALRIDFSAVDKDGDSLSYRFVNGINWLAQGVYNPSPTSTFAYGAVPYNAGYSATNPMGTGVTINAATGLITGTAPPAGRYLVSVAVTEWRNGTAICEHIKEIPIIIGNCDFVEAALPATIRECNGGPITFENNAVSSGILAYKWIFDTLHPAIVSTLPTPTYQYTDTGTYTARLVVTGASCKDSVTTRVLMYPKVRAALSMSGGCIRYPFTFTDNSIVAGNTIVSWQWVLDDSDPQQSASSLQNPSFTYRTAGTKTVRLIAGSDKGCLDTVTSRVTVIDKPALILSFHDTTICRTDTVRLLESSSYTAYQWTPALSIRNAVTASPDVYPAGSVKYFVSVTQNNCDNIDSVQVTVLAKDAVNAGADTIICKGDPVYLHVTTTAGIVSWYGDAVQRPGAALTQAIPLVSQSYIISANPGKCVTRDTVAVKVVPYPSMVLSPDTTICFGDKAFIRAVTNAPYYSWSPVNTLSDPTTVTTYAAPSRSVHYVFAVTDTLGCPKTVKDSVTVNVTPAFHVWAGNDTVTVAGQPLQLQASVTDPSPMRYQWIPAFSINDPSSSSPIITLNSGTDSVIYKVTAFNGACYAEDEVVVKLFAGNPDMYIPNAFTPNGDGLNDQFRVKPVGIAQFELLQIFNRDGQMLFMSSDAARGWDGTFKGKGQPAGTYIYIARGKSYAGFVVEKKGSFVLIR